MSDIALVKFDREKNFFENFCVRKRKVRFVGSIATAALVFRRCFLERFADSGNVREDAFDFRPIFRPL